MRWVILGGFVPKDEVNKLSIRLSVGSVQAVTVTTVRSYACEILYRVITGISASLVCLELVGQYISDSDLGWGVISLLRLLHFLEN